ncbi:signal peptidase I [Chondrinema litorale]|uniref:signal peptidase I n=1 Tax=Chondrinema litorale TaxID=2994555 RepID=UPI0025446ED7|nr:signal peptidase I [Chondrinema litorale]UZR93304.1 signal peptidase I [Chondrinema litorale]
MKLKEKEKTSEKPKKGPVREWVDAIVFAVIAATIIRWLFIEAFTIPTPSMEKSLLVGDFLFVSKVHYGARTPKTPLQVPLTHQKIWGTEIPSYVDWIQLPQFRLPGFTDVKNNDVVVFNYPDEYNKYPVDLRTNYIKRCIGISGDKLEIKNKDVYINGELLPAPEEMQTSYKVTANTLIKSRVFENLDITDYTDPMTSRSNSGTEYYIQSSDEKVKKLESYDFVKDVEEITFEIGQDAARTFPNSPLYDWSLDNFGPLYIPKEGDKIAIDSMTLPLYEKAILQFEGNEDAKVEGGKLYLDGNVVTEYTFKQNYYFMMGDNRHNSQDSRIWGFVPEDHILGKGLLIWWSVEPVGPDGGLSDIFTRIRWSRIFKLIE